MKTFVVKFPVDYGVSQLIVNAESKEDCVEYLINTINENSFTADGNEYYLNDTALSYFGNCFTKKEALYSVVNAEIRELHNRKGISNICKYIE